MESVLEVQRRTHEELDRVELAAMAELAELAKTHRERIAQDTRVFRLLERAQLRSKQLLDQYEDGDNARQDEIQAISGPNEFSEFYKRLKVIKDYHRRFPNEMAEPMELEFVQMEKDKEKTVEALESQFSGEEMFGKYLDLIALHSEYINLKNIKPISYTSYLDYFDHFKTVPREVKTTTEYRVYLEHINSYILGFLYRTQPLVDMTGALKDIEAEFDQKWSKNQVPGWENRHAMGAAEGETSDTPSNLYCVACAKLFAKQTVFDAHLNGGKHKKAAEALMQRTNGAIDERVVEAERRVAEEAAQAKERYVALLEYQAHAVASNMLKTQRDATKSFVDLKQSRTGEELEEDKEAVAEETMAEEESDDEEKPIYNPLNLPLGWDGKPIPFWLYKLHGLSVSYYCEICDTTFRGRKAFERHFTEWNHSNMLKRLGIPNTSQFQEITRVHDALALWEKIQRDKDSIVFKADAEEEFEDDRGNVFIKKTYEDLMRQGLL